ncbi:hypothetical protein [Alteromonas halophila]|uniref:Uncharacterized protein n=1 Tax=Alteromonas halophila TaxID=516698 RepID=A0A918JJX5_9ALTE|nr:hypothetical protein [Alteromonas halophila]GGW82407.1 hypothetical protein GCM10007391_14310 [Alteromonas halophila]
MHSTKKATVLGYVNIPQRVTSTQLVQLNLPDTWRQTGDGNVFSTIKPLQDRKSNVPALYKWSSHEENEQQVEVPLYIVAIPPTEFLMSALQTISDAQEISERYIAQLLRQWVDLTRLVCRAALLYQKNVYLMLDHGVTPSKAFVSKLADNDVTLPDTDTDMVAERAIVSGEANALASFLRESILKNDEVHELWEELVALSRWRHPDTVIAPEPVEKSKVSTLALLNQYHYQQLKLVAAEQQIASLKSELLNKDEKLSEADLLSLQIGQLQEELEQTAVDAKEKEATYQRNIDKLTQSLEEQKSAIKTAEKLNKGKRNSATEETDLLQLQVAQLKEEELEHTFQVAKTDKSRAENLEAQLAGTKAELAKKHEQLEHERKKQQKSAEQLAATKMKHDTTDSSIDENIISLNEEKELMQLQIAQLQEELEYYYLAYQAEQRKPVPKSDIAVLDTEAPALKLISRII